MIKSDLDAGKPYSVWESPANNGWFCVVDKNGFNMMRTGTDTTIFCTREIAKEFAEFWNHAS